MQTHERPEPDLIDDVVPPEPRSPAEDRRLGLQIVIAELALIAVGTYVWGWKVPAGILLLHLILVPMVLFHEFGHYWTAKKFGIASKEFFVGFGPRLWSRKRGETEFGVKAFILLGGYVKIVGMSQYEDVAPRFHGRTFRDAKRWQRFLVLVAGSTTHFITALVLLFCILVFVGQGSANTALGKVEPNTPAAAAGLKTGDKLLTLNGQRITSWVAVRSELRSHPNQPVTITYERDGQTHTVTPTLATTIENGKQYGQLGVSPGLTYHPVSPVRAVPMTFQSFWSVIYLNGKAVGTMFSGSNLKCLGNEIAGGKCHTEYRTSSPVGVANVALQTLQTDFLTFLFLIITINIFVGVFNLLPLLPLDGGHIAILAIEGVASTIARRPVEIDQRYLIPIAVAVIGLLVMMFVSSLYLDILSPPQLPK